MENEHGDVLGEGFNQMKTRPLDKGQHALGNSLVVQRVVDGIGQRSLADIGAELDIDENVLFDLPFPVEYADDGLGFQRMNEDFIQSF